MSLLKGWRCTVRLGLRREHFGPSRTVSLGLLIILFAFSLPTIAFGLPKDRNELERYVYNHPDDGKALYRLTQILVKEKNFDRAIPHLNKLIEIFPKKGKLRYNLALALYKTEKHHQARLVLLKVLQDEPDNQKAKKLILIIKRYLAERTKNLASIALKTYDNKEPYKARRICHQIFAIDPLSEIGLLVNAMLEDDDCNVDLAREGYEAVLKQNSSNGRAAARLAAILLNDGKTERAKKLLVVAQRETPNLPSTNSALAKLLASENRYYEAVEATDRALASGSRDTTLLVFRFNCLLNLKDFAEAKATLDKIEHDFKGMTTIPFLLGRLHFAMGDFEKSIEEMKRYLALDIPVTTLTVDSLKVISSIYERFGQFKAAVEHINRAIKLMPHNTELLAQKAILREKWRIVTMGKLITKGAFTYNHLDDLSDSVLSRIHSIFKRAYETICPLYGASPKNIKVKILEVAALKLPAFYDSVTDEIVISREYFERELAPESVGVEEHIILHEFAHFVLRHKVGKKVFIMKNMWMIEGLAEYHSRAHLRERKKLKELFDEPLLSFSQLNNFVVVAALDMGKTRFKAYLQSCLMVEAIIQRYPRDGVRRLVKVMIDQANNIGQEKALLENLSLSGKDIKALTRGRLDYYSQTP